MHGVGGVRCDISSVVAESHRATLELVQCILVKLRHLGLGAYRSAKNRPKSILLAVMDRTLVGEVNQRGLMVGRANFEVEVEVELN